MSSSSSSSSSTSSNNCKKYPSNGAAMADSEENKEKRVCFICGSHTTLFINIYERRCGPNMIDVISEKFKMRPLNDDKFLCYSCNNWLINWYSMQKRTKNNKANTNDRSSNEDAAQQNAAATSSTMSATIMANAYEQTATKISDDDIQYDDTNEMVIISDEEVDENIDCNNIIQTLRNRLKKYLYYPNRPKCSNQHEMQVIHPPYSALVELNGTRTNDDWNCKQCGKFFRNRLNRLKQRILCRSCRFLLRRYGNSAAVSYKTHKNHSKSIQHDGTTAHRLPNDEKRQSIALSTNCHNNIFTKLQQLGTSIYYENEYHASTAEQHQHQHYQQRESYHIHRHMTSIPHEIDMESQKNGTRTWQRCQDGSNEILMTFNTVVTEVFPIDELYNKYFGRSNDDQISNESKANHINIQEILRNVPKSLTITIAQ